MEGSYETERGLIHRKKMKSLICKSVVCLVIVYSVINTLDISMDTQNMNFKLKHMS